jgi:hypothetical protein
MESTTRKATLMETNGTWILMANVEQALEEDIKLF